MALTKVYDAATVFKHLNGIINVYKPAGMKVKHVRNAILGNICKGLNEMELREPRKLASDRPLLGTGTAADSVLHNIASNTDLSDHILAAGPRYMPGDIRCATVAALGDHTSGVLLFGINKGLKQSSRIQRNRPVRVYHVTACMGTATEDHLPDSRITVRSNHRHVSADRISGLAASMQASHQRKMYELCGVDLQTQAAYELACKGLIRPADNTQPVIYGIKLIHFERPHFTLELHAINESEQYIAALVHDMALELRTVAHCSQVRCVRHAHFDVTGSLLRHGWHLPGIIKNLRQQREILEAHPQLLEQERVELHAAAS
ncbi:mitochondrial mRNA pseudouridine synthase Trub2 [Drosophila innubila]|uniref:mitochondrial mRNA pseudouridine synthase Trub2 n=1 Tax=Drosophila innubila TaxID=198719 RepID=UPI00148B8DA4|nr:mitochondrial mRNA pseudouridine synthase Trub2 [Drosophila innubila]XP_034478484.1 mitochondrial mRNA pseudouridine synthase Trub2 [Drosophila innubila]